MLLDFSIGLILFISLWIFYEVSVIFYVMMHIHTMLLVFLVDIFIKFWEVVYEFIINPCWIIGYIIPFIVQISFAAICVIVRASLNEIISIRDVIIICIIPGIMALLPFIFTDLQKLASKDAKYNIYNSFLGVLGLISNTLILILGGLIGLHKF
ncbi:hypothetical protein NIES267_57780 [Calothrix parasitica NIES-267]|uniref:Uncharacterized protein n=1 Tax=Calothrix parasitica NIES-267 TaxID=1973488 RepID=A0A1Z4LYI3_9CYAN|nr:hypothetical protein NIES267_57780 [Calothrix parasitica NIES-267]